MGKIYVGQTALTFQATTGEDITDATCAIKYKKPNGTTGSWDAEIVTALTGVIKYEISEASDLDMAGDWIVWAYITFVDGTVVAGEPATISVYSEGR